MEVEYYILQNRQKHLVILDKSLKVVLIGSSHGDSEEIATYVAENLVNAFEGNKISFELPEQPLPYLLRGLRASDGIIEAAVKQMAKALIY